MAVIKNKVKKRYVKECSPLQAFTAAALVLPGLMLSPAQAADEEEVDFQYSHYQESDRELFGNRSKFAPIEVDSLHGGSKIKLADRVRFAFNYTQDTWGGATPITTAPEAIGGNGRYTGKQYQDQFIVKAGATPYILGDVFFDSKLNVLNANYGKDPLKINNRLVHTLSLASPETRKQGDFKLGYDWDEAALDIGGGTSIEDDYESGFGNVNGRWDFNQKLTSVNLGLSYTGSDTRAILDHDAIPYIYESGRSVDYNARHKDSQLLVDSAAFGKNTLKGQRQDWGSSLGITQVLTKNTLLNAGLGFTRSTGYMANPYKVVEVAFIDPEQQQFCDAASIGGSCGQVQALLEERPTERNQWTGNLGFVQYIDGLDAALHTGYHVFTDDWGITSHTFDADWVQPLGSGWTVTPRVRYYSQDAASFYSPFLISQQGVTSNNIDPVKGQAYTDFSGSGKLYYDDLTGLIPAPVDTDGNPIVNPNTGLTVVDAKGHVVTDPNIVGNLGNDTKPFVRSKLPAYYSSDQRLSGFGALSGGVTVSKQFAKGIALDLGVEYYTHQGALKLGGGGEAAYADYDYWMANAALKVNLSALSIGGGHGDTDHDHLGHGVHAPAGVMFDHMLPKAGDMMVGYRYMYGSQGGNMLTGGNAVNDPAVVRGGCGPNPCFLAPDNMAMHMHMLDLMIAPTDWLTLMLMPQFVDMNMSMRKLDGVPPGASPNNNVGNPRQPNGDLSNIAPHMMHHLINGHETGGIGDLGMYALFKLFDNGMHHVHVTGGISAPIGDVDIGIRRNHTVDGGFLDYGMQLGSGTWDFKPSLTYTGHMDQFSWGAQTSGTVRMEKNNESGYALGDIFQSTAWGNYDLTHWLSASIRGVYTIQGGINGKFNGLINQFGPMDYTANYGGQYWDVGFGLSAVVPSGSLAGNRVSVEWLQPVKDDVNGYQLERDGALSANWSVGF